MVLRKDERIQIHGKEIIHEYYETRYERTNRKHDKLDEYCMIRSIQKF